MEIVKNISLEENCFDCGVYMCTYMVALAVGDVIPPLFPNNAIDIRIRMLLELKGNRLLPFKAMGGKIYWRGELEEKLRELEAKNKRLEKRNKKLMQRCLFKRKMGSNLRRWKSKRKEHAEISSSPVRIPLEVNNSSPLPPPKKVDAPISTASPFSPLTEISSSPLRIPLEVHSSSPLPPPKKVDAPISTANPSSLLTEISNSPLQLPLEVHSSSLLPPPKKVDAPISTASPSPPLTEISNNPLQLPLEVHCSSPLPPPKKADAPILAASSSPPIARLKVDVEICTSSLSPPVDPPPANPSKAEAEMSSTIAKRMRNNPRKKTVAIKSPYIVYARKRKKEQ